MVVVPMTFKRACEFIALNHRTHKPPIGHKFSLGALDDTEAKLHGVVIVSRPIARAFDDGLTAEVTRTCTDGFKNVNSFLYAAAWRVCREMGYVKLITYTQAGESGVSLKAAGWTVIAERNPRSSWRESSVKLKFMKDPIGCGGIARTLWGISKGVN